MYTILVTKRAVLDVKVNEDGSLLISNGDGESIAYAGSLIKTMGGIEGLMSKCIQSEKSALELKKENNIQEAVTLKERASQKEVNKKAEEDYLLALEARYNDLMKMDVIPSNVENISIILQVLNKQNWGTWSLPKMEIGYKCNQYDCNGKMASTMVLDRPINYDGELVNRFEFGAPRGHLERFKKIR